MLLEAGADPDAALPGSREPRELGMPLVNAFASRHFDVIDLLIAHHAIINAFPYCGTPIIDQVYNSICELSTTDPEGADEAIVDLANELESISDSDSSGKKIDWEAGSKQVPAVASEERRKRAA